MHLTTLPLISLAATPVQKNVIIV